VLFDFWMLRTSDAGLGLGLIELIEKLTQNVFEQDFYHLVEQITAIWASANFHTTIHPCFIIANANTIMAFITDTTQLARYLKS
jgi:hypothetical protein